MLGPLGGAVFILAAIAFVWGFVEVYRAVVRWMGNRALYRHYNQRADRR